MYECFESFFRRRPIHLKTEVAVEEDLYGLTCSNSDQCSSYFLIWKLKLSLIALYLGLMWELLFSSSYAQTHLIRIRTRSNCAQSWIFVMSYLRRNLIFVMRMNLFWYEIIIFIKNNWPQINIFLVARQKDETKAHVRQNILH